MVRDAEQAYWLHLAVMGQPRSSARTADLDGYTANRAVGRWIEGTALPYAIAVRELLPGEVLGTAEVIRTFGTAVIIKRRRRGMLKQPSASPRLKLTSKPQDPSPKTQAPSPKPHVPRPS